MNLAESQPQLVDSTPFVVIFVRLSQMIESLCYSNVTKDTIYNVSIHLPVVFQTGSCKGSMYSDFHDTTHRNNVCEIPYFLVHPDQTDAPQGGDRERMKRRNYLIAS